MARKRQRRALAWVGEQDKALAGSNIISCAAGIASHIGCAKAGVRLALLHEPYQISTQTALVRAHIRTGLWIEKPEAKANRHGVRQHLGDSSHWEKTREDGVLQETSRVKFTIPATLLEPCEPEARSRTRSPGRQWIH